MTKPYGLTHLSLNHEELDQLLRSHMGDSCLVDVCAGLLAACCLGFEGCCQSFMFNRQDGENGCCASCYGPRGCCRGCCDNGEYDPLKEAGDNEVESGAREPDAAGTNTQPTRSEGMTSSPQTYKWKSYGTVEADR